MSNAEQIVKIFEAIGKDKHIFISDTLKGIVYGILRAVKNPKLKFYRSDAIAMFKGGIIQDLERIGDTATLEIIEAFIAEKN